MLMAPCSGRYQKYFRVSGLQLEGIDYFLKNRLVFLFATFVTFNSAKAKSIDYPVIDETI